MDTGRKPKWEEECHAPISARSTEDDGGVPGPSTSRGECELQPKYTHKSSVFACCHTLGRAERQKTHRLALAEASMHFAVLYHIDRMCKSAKDGLNFPVFNALGVAVRCPHSVAGRWAG